MLRPIDHLDDHAITALQNAYQLPGARNQPDRDAFRDIGNRSFPAGYRVTDPTGLDSWEALKQREDELRHELGMEGGVIRGARRRAKIATRADRRVMMGPSDEDVAALPHIEEAWCFAADACDQLGVRRSADPLHRNPHVRYGLLLDFLTRDAARRLAQRREEIDERDACDRYGVDVLRVSLEHGVTPDVIGEYLGMDSPG
jgi:hypothetical protein